MTYTLRYIGIYGETPTPIESAMVYMYILKSRKDNNLYIGWTVNIYKRLGEHNKGSVFSTKSRIPFELVYYEAYKSENDARNREKNLKLRSRAFAQLKKRIRESIQ